MSNQLWRVCWREYAGRRTYVRYWKIPGTYAQCAEHLRATKTLIGLRLCVYCDIWLEPTTNNEQAE